MRDTHLPHTKWGFAIIFGMLGSLAVALVVLAFLWPAKTASTQNLPVSIAGPAASVSALETTIGKASPGTFDFVSADNRSRAVKQIRSRETYGAIVVGAPGTAPEVLTAPAGSTVANQILTGLAAKLQAALAAKVAAAGGNPSSVIVDVKAVVPLASTDPSGAGLAAASFPLTLGGMIGGALATFLVVGPLRRLAALAGFAVASGLVLTLVLQTWFGYLQGNFWLNATGVGLAVLATAAFIAGCTSLIGSRGIAIGVLVTILIGTPLSAAATPWQFIAPPWGVIGQYFVPGSANSLIRSLSYFPDANASAQWWTLAAWTAAGVILTVAGHYRSRAVIREPRVTLESA